MVLHREKCFASLQVTSQSLKEKKKKETLQSSREKL